MAWKEYECSSRDPVILAINKKHDWMWKKIGRTSPFKAVHDKMLQDGYWLKSTLKCDQYGIYYYEITIGYYLKNVIEK